MSTPPLPPADSQQQHDTAQPRLARRYVPGWAIWTFLVLLLIAGLTVYLNGERLMEMMPAFGRAIANVLILLLVVIGILTLLVWLVVRSCYPWWLKVAIVLVVLSSPAWIKIEHSGDLFSTHVHLRGLAPDEWLEMPSVMTTSVTRPAPETSDPNAFPGFLGPNRDGSLPEVQLASWTDEPPELLWKHDIGAGWSGFAAAHGLAITQEQRGDQELVTAYEIKTGNPVWYHAEPNTRFEEEMGGVGPRATPTIDGNQVFAQGATGILVCLDFSTGELLWRRSVVTDVGSEPETERQLVAWGRAGSPLVDGDRVIVPGGGRDGNFISLIAYDRNSGEVLWEGGDQQISYSSPVIMTLAGRRQIVIVNANSVAGHDPETGQQLWSYERTGHSDADANTSQPQQVDGNHILVTKGYSLGAELLKVSADTMGEFSAASVWANSRLLRTKLTSAILRDGYAYGLNEGILECVEVDSGKRIWKGGRYRHGQLLIAGDDLVVLSEGGDLYQLPATPQKPTAAEAIPAVHGITWNTLCLAGEYLLVRNAREAACYRVKLSAAVGEATGGDQ